MLEQVKAGEVRYPCMADGWISDLIREGRESRPDSPALLREGAPPISYVTLFEQLAAILEPLQDAGLSRRCRVATLVPDGPLHAMLLLALADAATAVPLNPEWPAERLEDAIRRTRASAVVIAAGAKLREHDWQVPVIDLCPSPRGATGVFQLRVRERVDWKAVDSEARVVLLTSGSTATPKVVPLTSENLCSSVLATVRALRLSSEDVRLNMSPLFHVSGIVHGLLAPLASGGSVAAMPGYDIRRVFQWIELLRPTWFSVVPSFLRAMLAEPERLRSAIRAAPLRFVRVGAAPLSVALRETAERILNLPVIHAYGMTETCSQIACDPLPPGRRKPGSVGLPEGPEVAILSGAGEPVPDGAIGEICVRGPGVMTGYEGEETPRFGTWFRTRDLGRFDEEGYLYVVGRRDEVINRRGEMVSPVEVEEILCRHKHVLDAVAFPAPLEDGSEDLHAAVVLRPGMEVSERQLRAFVAAQAAASRVPARIVVADVLPRGPTGKVRRKELAALLCVAQSNPIARRSLESETQRIVARIWEESFGKIGMAADSDFFELGGDSMTASRIMARVAEGFGVELTLATFFERPTIASISEWIDTVRNGGGIPG